MDGQTPGDGANPPFGNGKGATSSGGAASGGHNFLEEPSGGSKSGGRDFTKENRAQESGSPEDRYNKDSVPTGGDLPFDDTDETAEGEREMQIGQTVDSPKAKPFKLTGGGG